jgi:hypothetical protein
MGEPAVPVADNKPENSTALRTAVRWYLLGFGLLGAVSGYLAGASQSPIVGVILPLLFAIAGTTSGLYFLQIDLNAPEAITRIRLLGQGMIVFLVPFGLMVAYGSAIRSGLGVSGFFSSAVLTGEQVTLPSLEKVAPEDAVSISLLRARLQLLGIPAPDQRVILAAAIKSLAAAKNPEQMAVLLVGLSKRAGLLRQAIEKRIGSNDEKAPEGIKILAAICEDFEYTCGLCVMDLQQKSGPDLPKEINSRLEHFGYRFEDVSVAYGRGSREWLLQQNLAKDLEQFRYALSVATMQKPEVGIAECDVLLRLLHPKGAEGEPKPEEAPRRLAPPHPSDPKPAD